MNYKTQTNQLQVTRNGEPDLSFQRAIKHEQRRRYAAQLAKQAVMASIKTTGRTMFTIYTRVYDDINKTNYSQQYFGTVEEQKLAQLRNVRGQFITTQ